MRSSIAVRRVPGKNGQYITAITQRRNFHDYFVTHLPSSSLHPDSRVSSGPHHQLPRSASKPHEPRTSGGPSPAPLLGPNRDTTVVRIPIRSAKHHFGAALSRGQRPYNEDTYQAGVIELPAFAKRVPLNLTRAPASSPLQAYREGQRKQQEQRSTSEGDGEGRSADGASGDPQVFYFGVFDGHGGTECSGFLREKLHEYVEEASQQYGLQSSLSKKTSQNRSPKPNLEPSLPVAEKSDLDRAATADESKTAGSTLRASKDRDTAFPLSEPSSTPPDSIGRPHSTQGSSSRGSATPEQVASLQKNLIHSWRETVGGYFRRFSPSAFALEPPTIATVLCHAFLTADLSFITAQLRLSASDSDPVLADSPINTSDI
ncbi:MAG: hypothetical protein Q9222_003667, partial [Ikaeria aurantiellina]